MVGWYVGRHVRWLVAMLDGWQLCWMVGWLIGILDGYADNADLE